VTSIKGNHQSLLDLAETAEYLRMSEKALESLRLSGEGPPVVQISDRRLRYRRADLETWVELHLVTYEGRSGRAVPKRTGLSSEDLAGIRRDVTNSRLDGQRKRRTSFPPIEETTS
jgi:predicted DNA-binding transcriptional regulator AlpA